MTRGTLTPMYLLCRKQSGHIRPYGDSELLVEASFADLRHGGDGDITKAYKLVQKVREYSYLLAGIFRPKLI